MYMLYFFPHKPFLLFSLIDLFSLPQWHWGPAGNTLSLKSSFPLSLNVYFGSAWWMISRANQFYLDKLTSREDRKGKKDGFFELFSRGPRLLLFGLLSNLIFHSSTVTLWYLWYQDEPNEASVSAAEIDKLSKSRDWAAKSRAVIKVSSTVLSELRLWILV